MALESIANSARVPGNAKWSQISREANDAAKILAKKSSDILASVPSENKEKGEALLASLKEKVSKLVAAAESKDADNVFPLQQAALKDLGDIEDAMISQFPFEIPSEYDNLPRLLGRATLDIQIEVTQPYQGEDKKVRRSMKAVVDGYSAPLTAGNFVDLVNRGFYDGLPFTRADGFVCQSGDPDGPAEGFIDPKTGTERNVPLEILVQGDKEPTYGVTLEEAGRYKALPKLPFAATGTIAMARPEFDNNAASSQFFMLIFEADLTPAGLNLLDGRYSVFGYVTENAEVLKEVHVDDKILSVKVVEGLEHLVVPTAAQ